MATVAFLAVQCFNSSPGLAQQAAYARDRTESAADLAHRALDCLHRGDDKFNRDAKLADYRAGLELAQRALAVDDNNADAHFARFANNGRIMLLEGVAANPFTLLTASRELDRTLELNPNHHDALAAKGGLYRQLPWLLGGSLAKAVAYLSRAIDLDPNSVASRIELAQTYRDMGEPQRGVPLLEKAAAEAERQGRYRELGEARTLLHELNAQK